MVTHWMRQAAVRLLGEVGLAPATRVKMLRRQIQKAERARGKAELTAARATAEADRRVTAAGEAARERLGAVERTVVQAQERSMAIEVKLMILEGAVTVLDERFRALAAGSSGDAWWASNAGESSQSHAPVGLPEAADGGR